MGNEQAAPASCCDDLHHRVLFGYCRGLACFIRKHAGGHGCHWRLHGVLPHPGGQSPASVLLEVQIFGPVKWCFLMNYQGDALR